MFKYPVSFIIFFHFGIYVIKQKGTCPFYTCSISIDHFSYEKSLLLIGEAEVDTEGRVDKALELALSLETITVLAKGSQVLSVQEDQVGTISLNAGRGDGLGQD